MSNPAANLRKSLRLLDLGKPLPERDAKPTGWPAKHAGTLAELRRRFLAGTVELWSWYPKGAPAKGGRPALEPGTVELDMGDGTTWAGTLDELAALLEVAPVKVTRAARPTLATASKVRPPVELDDVAHPTPAAARAEGSMLDAYLARLVHPPKQAYAAAYAAHLVDGAPAPAEPDAEWADSVRRKVTRYVAA